MGIKKVCDHELLLSGNQEMGKRGGVRASHENFIFKENLELGSLRGPGNGYRVHVRSRR